MKEIQKIRNLVEKEKIGGLILMQDDAEKHINLLNEFQGKSRIKMMIGIDGEWGLFQRFPASHKFPWAMTLGAIQDNSLIYEMTSKIAEDCKRMGIYWDFAPVVDVNTNPSNPIIGNRSFGSDINKLITLPIYSSEVFENYIASLNNNYKLISQEKALNKDQLERA